MRIRRFNKLEVGDAVYTCVSGCCEGPYVIAKKEKKRIWIKTANDEKLVAIYWVYAWMLFASEDEYKSEIADRILAGEER
jgi:hypothetical protein